MMQSYGTVLGQSSNAAFNDPARAALMREEKFKRKLAEIEAKGAQDIKQQETANTGAQKVQESKNIGEQQNTQLTGDIQKSLRDSMVEENLSKVGLNKAQGDYYDSGGQLHTAQANQLDIDSAVKSRYGMQLGEKQVAAQDTLNKVNESAAERLALETQGQQAKLDKLVDPSKLTATDLAALRSNQLVAEGKQIPQETTPTSSISRSIQALIHPGGFIGQSVGSDIASTVKKLFKTRKLTF
jgi:hypothetical protein